MNQGFETDRATLEREVTVTFFRSGGPGGQHRNKTETGVRISHERSGIRVTATERRSQRRNLELAWQRLIDKLEELNRPRKPRRPTRPSRAAEERRLAEKRRRARTKEKRSPPREDD